MRQEIVVRMRWKTGRRTLTLLGGLLLLYLGCIPTALAYVLFQAGMRSTPATLTSILTLAEPPVYRDTKKK